jgi:hypothetical protein
MKSRPLCLAGKTGSICGIGAILLSMMSPLIYPGKPWVVTLRNVLWVLWPFLEGLGLIEINRMPKARHARASFVFHLLAFGLLISSGLILMLGDPPTLFASLTCSLLVTFLSVSTAAAIVLMVVSLVVVLSDLHNSSV